MKWHFRYFDASEKNAEFTDTPCESCGSDENCLEGVYFDELDFDRESVCLECLVQGKITVHLSDYLIDKLKRHIKLMNPTLQNKEVLKAVNQQVEELKKTPPIPWIQSNDWVICCGEFAKYIGEWSQKDLNEASKNNDGLAYFLEILEQDYKDRVDDSDLLWDDLGNQSAAYVFECLNCSQRIANWQNY